MLLSNFIKMLSKILEIHQFPKGFQSCLIGAGKKAGN
jgi:hypothetical protein